MQGLLRLRAKINPRRGTWSTTVKPAECTNIWLPGVSNPIANRFGVRSNTMMMAIAGITLVELGLASKKNV